MQGGGRGLLLWSAQGGMGIWRRDSQIWDVHGGLSAAGVSAGTTEVGNQSSLGGSEFLVTGVGICIFACLPLSQGMVEKSTGVVKGQWWFG